MPHPTTSEPGARYLKLSLLLAFASPLVALGLGLVAGPAVLSGPEVAAAVVTYAAAVVAVPALHALLALYVIRRGPPWAKRDRWYRVVCAGLVVVPIGLAWRIRGDVGASLGRPAAAGPGQLDPQAWTRKMLEASWSGDAGSVERLLARATPEARSSKPFLEVLIASCDLDSVTEIPGEPGRVEVCPWETPCFVRSRDAQLGPQILQQVYEHDLEASGRDEPLRWTLPPAIGACGEAVASFASSHGGVAPAP